MKTLGRGKMYVLVAITALCVGAFLLQILHQFKGNQNGEPGEMHFVLIVPAQESEESEVRNTATAMAEEYRLDIEFHAFSTVAEQKQLLRLLAETDVDGVLLWPISVNDTDYAEELLALQEAEIPVVVVDRDVDQELRNSFIGSGASSDLVVLNQSLKTLDRGDSFMVGNQSGSGSSQVVELLLFEQATERDVDPGTLRDKKLRQMILNPPEGYQAVDYIQMTGKSAQSLSLKYTLINLFSTDDAPGLFFSLDDTLSATAISAKKSVSVAWRTELQLLCYGDVARYEAELNSGDLNGLVTSRPAVSVSIGIRYLRDICRDFWVPETMDSGIAFWTSGAA